MKFNQFYQLIVSDGLTDLFGNHLHDAGSSTPGVGHVATLAAGRNLDFIDSTGDAVSLVLRRGGLMQLTLAPNGDADTLVVKDTVSGRSVLSGSVKKPKRGTSNGTTNIQSLSVPQATRFRSTLKNPPFTIGPLPQSAVDELLLLSDGTLASVLIAV